jgi:hypothetical protein
MKPFLALVLSFVVVPVNGQGPTAAFKTVTVDKKVREFSERFDLTSPLNSFITLNYILINGQDHLLRSTSSVANWSFLPDSTAPNSEVSEGFKERLLNAHVHEVIVYKDSIAFVISHILSEYGESYYSIRAMYLELGRWVNSGESARKELMDARQFVLDRADLFFQEFKRTQSLYQRN